MLISAHAELLTASAISPEVVEARGYWTATNTRELVDFAAVQRRVPALVIPQHNVLGEEAHSMIRPDDPRERSGKVVKYETPSKVRQVLDVNPLARVMLDDPTIPLVVTEGSRKADAAVSRGICAVSINGVWGWRGTNAKGGKTALDDWGLVALNGRTVLLAFDDDAMRNRKVHQALAALAGFLGMKRAVARYVMFPPNASGAKVGLDDWLAANPDAGFIELDALSRAELPELEAREPVETFSDVEEEPGWAVLESVAHFVRRFVWLPDDRLAGVVALWITHTHLIEALDTTPRLHIRSPMKRSGKSRLLEVIALLVRRPMSASMTTAAVLYRSIEAFHPTLLVDEVDQLLGNRATDEQAAGVVGVINLGFQSGVASRIPRTVGQGADMHVEHFETFAPLVMAGIGRTVPDMVADRSIIVRLERRPASEPVEPFRRRSVAEPAAALARRIAAWCARNADDIAAARPASPPGLNDRAADIWEPLLAIADAAGTVWPARAREVAVALSGVADAEDLDSTMELQLLADLRETWPSMDRRFSAEIVKSLNMLDDRPWADLGRGAGITTNWLARKLRDFGIHSTKVRIGSEAKQGYYEDRFVGVWERYGVTDAASAPPTPAADGTNRTDGTEQVNGSAPTRSVPSVPPVPPLPNVGGAPARASDGDGWEDIG